MRNKRVHFITQAAIIAALYVVLTFSFATFSSKAIQVRLSEVLTILPYFTPAAIPGLFIGCLCGNLIAGNALPDVLFGSLATLIGALGTYLLRKQTKFSAPIPPILSNALIVPFILKYAYGEPFPIPYMMLTVGIGQLISCGVLGLLLLGSLDKYKKQLFHIKNE